MWPSYKIVSIIFNMSISLVGTAGSFLVLGVFVLKPELRTPSNWCTIASSLSSLFISAIHYPLIGLVDARIINDNPMCWLLLVVSILCMTCYSLYMAAMTVERYISICHPLYAPMILTGRRVGIALALIFVYAFLISVTPVFTPLYYKGDLSQGKMGCRASAIIRSHLFMNFLTVNFMIPLPVMVATYGRIFFVLRRHIRAVVDQSATIRGLTSKDHKANPTNNNPEVPAADIVEASRRKRQRWQQEARSALLLFIIIVSYAVCWVPYVHFMLNTAIDTSYLAYVLIHAEVYSTAAIQPYLYGFGNKVLRSAIMTTFCKRVLPRKTTPLIMLNEPSLNTASTSQSTS